MLVIALLSQNEEIHDDDNVGTSLVFSPLGLVAGMLFISSIVFSFLAVDCIGLALGQGIWGGVAILTSYIWGVLVFEETPTDIGLSVCGVVVLIFGVGVLAFCEPIANWMTERMREHSSPLSPLMGGPSSTELSGRPTIERASYNIEFTPTEKTAAEVKAMNFKSGISYAVAVGLFGGSILAPLHFVPDPEKGFCFVPSFGIGALVAATCVFLCYWYILYRGRYKHSSSITFLGSLPEMRLDSALPLGALSGLLFNCSNVLSIIAIPALGYGVAYPLLQCAILVSGMWGIFVFHEIRGRTTIAVFSAGALVLLGGAVMLALAQ